MQRRSWLCQSITGAAIPACSITVYTAGTTTKATIYGDQAGSSSLGNPITAGSDGTYAYYAPSGRYTEVLSAPGFTFGAAQTQDFILHDPFAIPAVAPNIFATTTWLNATPNCANIASPTTGKTWCFDTTPTLKVWNGRAFVPLAATIAACDNGGVVDVTTCLQTAINRAGFVSLPAGTYKVSATLTFPTTAPTILSGAGVGNTLIQCTHNDGTDCVSISGALNNIYHELRDLQIDCTAGNLAAGNGLNINGAANGIPVTVRHVFVSDCRTTGKAGVNLTSSFNALFDSLIVTDSYYGVHLTLSNANIFTAVNFSSNVYGVYVESNSNSNIFAGGEIANGPTLIYCNGFFNDFNVYIENGGLTQQGVANAFGPTVQFDTASFHNRLGTKTSGDEKIQDKGIGNLIVSANSPSYNNLQALQFASPFVSGRSVIANSFFDSSFATAANFGGGGGGLAITQDTTTGVVDGNSLKLAYDGTAPSNGLVATSTQTWLGLTGELMTATFWIKASRDMLDTETARAYWNNDTGAAVLQTAFIKGLKAGVWTPVTLATRPLGSNITMSLRFQFNAPTGAFTAINLNVDDVHVEKFPVGANGTAQGPAGYAYVLNNSTGATRTLTNAGLYAPKATIDTVTGTLLTFTGTPGISTPLYFGPSAAGPEINYVGNIFQFSAGTSGLRFVNSSNSIVLGLFTDGGGLTVGTPTGGDKGLGTINMAGSLFLPDGTAAAPAFTFSSDTQTGIFRQGVNTLSVANAGVERFRLGGNTLNVNGHVVVGGGGSLRWDATFPNTGDLFLARDAANTLALKNSTSANTLRVYGTTTGPKYVALGHDGSDANLAVTGGGAINLTATAVNVNALPIATMLLTNASGTTTNNAHMVQDTVTLTGGTAGVALAGNAAYTNATSYTCVCDNDTAVLACRVVQNGGNGFTVTSGAGTDVIRFICVGN